MTENAALAWMHGNFPAFKNSISTGFSRSKNVDGSCIAIILAKVVLPHCLGPSSAAAGWIRKDFCMSPIGFGLVIQFMDHISTLKIGKSIADFQD